MHSTFVGIDIVHERMGVLTKALVVLECEFDLSLSLRPRGLEVTNLVMECLSATA